MSKKIEGDFLGFPGSLADQVSKAQGGDFFGAFASGPDVLPTHPSSSRSSRSKGSVEWSVHYKQFDLSDSLDVQELESILTRVRNNPQMMRVRHEKLANDKEGFTIVTLSWEEGKLVKPSPKKEETDVHDLLPFPSLPDGHYPGSGSLSPHVPDEVEPSNRNPSKEGGQ